MVDLGERNRAEFKKTKHLISDVTPGCSIYRDCFGSPETAAHVQELVIPVTKGSGHTQHGLHYCTQPRGSLYPPRGSKCRLQNALLPSRRNCFQNMIKYREMRQNHFATGNSRAHMHQWQEMQVGGWGGLRPFGLTFGTRVRFPGLSANRAASFLLDPLHFNVNTVPLQTLQRHRSSE